MPRVKVLLFHTDRIAELKDAELRDGSLILDDKTFLTAYPEGIGVEQDKGIELLIPFFFKKVVVPLYIIKWDALFPAKVESKVEKGRETNLEGTQYTCPKCKKYTFFVPAVKKVERPIVSTVTFTRDVKNIPESIYKSERLKIAGGLFRIRKEIKILPIILFMVLIVTIIFLFSHFRLVKF